MSEAATDRRVRRTRQLLREALMELTLERGYDHITVQDILDRADVGRSTFYAHYRDKDDLLVSEFEAMHPSWTADTDGSITEPGRLGDFLEPLRIAFLQAGANRRQFKAMIGRQGSETIRRLLPEPVSNLVREHVRSHFPDWTGDEQQLAAGVQFIVGGFLGTLTWWLDTDSPATADEMFEACRSLLVEGAVSFFGPAQSEAMSTTP
ncbi:MAG TPA: TetR/AcrR family transcriptional regulator [Candidatus Limnocylindrales bacterium]